MAFNPKIIQDEIEEQYLDDDNNRPWIVGFSGGKDSTMLLQLVWKALKAIPREVRDREVYVICNNTLVENPRILEYSERVLKKIEIAAVEQSLPVKVRRTTPKLEDTFWINLLGLGYPAPNNSFRWCTERLKISPTTKFIKDAVSEFGEAIILLGTRKDESSKRSASIKKHEISGQRLRKHMLSSAYVYSPIQDVKVSELWQYLNQVPSPWKANNKELNSLYRNANGGDCPLVIDEDTPSCGNSRFGCWVCTVVNKDKSMEALVENGEEWMRPLVDFRNLLADNRNNPDWRMHVRRNGQDGKGPYTFAIRAHLLKELLTAQKAVQSEDPSMRLINYQELVGIQVSWIRDNNFDFNVSEIYHEVYGTKIEIGDEQNSLLREKKILEQSCENKEDYKLIHELLELQKSRVIMVNNRGLLADMDKNISRALGLEKY